MSENNLKLGTAEYWRDAYWRLAKGPSTEVRLDDDRCLDEIVGSGSFHIERMSKNRWFIEVGRCRFMLDGKRVKLQPLEVDTWADEKERAQERQSE